MPRLLALLILLSCAGLVHTRDLGRFAHGPRTADLFKAQTEQPKSAEDTARDMMEQSKWRTFSGEIWGGIVASKFPAFSGGLGFAFKVSGGIAVSIRVEYDQELGNPRDYRPQLRGAYLEPGVRLHLDFHPNIALYSNHGISVHAGWAYFQLDKRLVDSGLGKVFQLGVGTANVVGLEFGDDFVRGFAETGLRTQFMIIQQADKEIKGYQDDLREGLRFQWLAIRLGVRLYF